MKQAAPATIVDALRQYFLLCPVIDKSPVDVDFLAEGSDRYSIGSEAADPIIKYYTDGTSLRQYLFSISFRGARGSVQQAIINSGQCEILSNWLELQTRASALPLLPNGTTAISIEAKSTGRAYQTSERDMTYEVPCRLVFFKER